MNETQILDAMGELSEALLAPVAALRAKKRQTWVRWAALAACLCLVTGLTLSWDGWRATKMDSLSNGSAEILPEDAPEEYYGYHADSSIADKTSLPSFQAKVLEVHDGYILVEPLDGHWERTSADKIVVSFSLLKEIPALAVGDMVEITYSGLLEETYPARARDVFAIERSE